MLSRPQSGSQHNKFTSHRNYQSNLPMLYSRTFGCSKIVVIKTMLSFPSHYTLQLIQHNYVYLPDECSLVSGLQQSSQQSQHTVCCQKQTAKRYIFTVLEQQVSLFLSYFLYLSYQARCSKAKSLCSLALPYFIHIFSIN